MNKIDWDFVTEVFDEVCINALPSVSQIQRENGGPFRILLSTVISLRTKDKVTLEASRRVFAKVKNAGDLIKIPIEELEKLIYPAAFFRVKSKNMKKIATILINEHSGKVPKDKKALLALPGVGLKTANLVLSLGFDIEAICVDTHVHRIANRLGWIKTKTAEESEIELQKVLPKNHWIKINELMVSYGQIICTPISPHCSICKLRKDCPEIDVNKSR